MTLVMCGRFCETDLLEPVEHVFWNLFKDDCGPSRCHCYDGYSKHFTDTADLYAMASLVAAAAPAKSAIGRTEVFLGEHRAQTESITW